MNINNFFRNLMVTAAVFALPAAAYGQVDSGVVNPVGSPILKDVVTADALPYAQLEARGSNAYEFGKDEYGPFITLNVGPEQIVKNAAISSEVGVNFPYKEGDVMRYSWRMRLLPNFTSDAPVNRWWLFARWSDQPNPRLGERPEDFLVYNPVMMFGYKQVEGKDMISISYGAPEAVTAGAFSIHRSQWVKFTVEVLWSHTDKGKASIYINNAKLPEREVSGPNMNARYQNIFRVGINRSAEIKTYAGIQVGDIKVERISEAPPPPPPPTPAPAW